MTMQNTERIIPLYNIGAAAWADTQSLYHAQAYLGLPALNIIWPSQPYVCLGRFQDLERDVDSDACAQHGLPLVRREVGGGAVYLDDGQVFYQLVLPRNWFTTGFDYRAIFHLGLDAVALALRRMGINANVRGANDVVIGRRKISGNGAGEVGQALVVVGNIIRDFNFETMAAVLRVPDEKFRDKAYHSMQENLVTLKQLEVEASNEQVAEVLAQACLEGLGEDYSVREAAALPEEVRAYMPAVAKRLTGANWLREVQNRREARRLRIRQGVELRETVRKAAGGLLRCQTAREGELITWLTFSGDIFAQPADALTQLEESLAGLPLGELKAATARFLATPGIFLPGVTPEDLAYAVAGQELPN